MVGELDGVKVLVVGDEPAAGLLVERTLSWAGAQVLVAADVHEAMRQLHAQHPDLVILDVVMPEIDGWGICRQIRSSQDTPVIFLSGLQSGMDVLRSFDAGAIDYMTKPFSPTVLVAHVCAALRKT